MIQLFDLNHNKLHGLTKYKDLKRESTLDGDEILSFSYPQNDPKYDDIKEECYIRTKDNEYVVKEVNISDDWTEFVCKINVEDLKGKPIGNFETIEQTCTDTVNLALAGTGWTIGYCDVTKRRTVRKSNTSSYEILQEIRKIYRCDFRFDAINKKIYIYNSMGEDKGVYFTDQLNLKKLEVQSNSYDYCTRIIPIGKDGLKITDINGGKDYVENYQYSNKVITVFWEDNRYTVAENLKEDAIERLEELSKPRRAYRADIIDLANASEDYKDVLNYGLGDTITLLSKDKKVKEKQRIIKLIEYPDEPERNTCEIANRIMDLADLQVEFEEAADTVDTITTSDGMVDDSKVNFDPIRQEFGAIVAEKADIGELNAAVARIGDLEVTKANITDLDAINARIDNLDVEDLEAINADITFLKVKVGDIDHLLAGNITAENIAVGAITAGSGIIADGAIGDAQISSLTAGKIVSGTIDTSLVTVAGADGKLNITGNRLQVINDGKERVALGDVNRDGTVYGLRVRGQDGQTVLFDERGLTREGLTDGAVDDSKVDDSANIQGHKLDINSVIREINIGDEVIKGTRVQVGDRSLDVELSTMRSSIGDNSQEISNQRSQIQALDDAIKLKVDKQEFREYKTTNDNRVTTIDTQLQKNTSSINVLQDEIALKVTQADIDRSIDNIEVGGRNLIPNSKEGNVHGYPQNPIWTMNGEWIRTSLPLNDCTEILENKFVNVLPDTTYTQSLYFRTDADEISFSFTFWGRDGVGHVTVPTKIYYLGDNLYRAVGTGKTKPNQVDMRVPDIEIINIIGGTFIEFAYAKLEKGTKATDWTPAPEDVESEITAINTQVSQLDINLNSITSRVSSTESNIVKINDDVSSIESRVRSAEQKITDDAIVSTVRRSSQYIDDLGKKVSKNTIISEINQSAESIKIQASKINLVGAVTVLSDISGNLGSITAGTVTGATIRTSASGDRLQLDSNYLRAYKSDTRRVQLDYDSLDFFNAKNQYSGSLYGVTYPQDDIPRMVMHSKSHVELVARADIDDGYSQNQARVTVSQFDEAYPSVAIEVYDSSEYSMFYVVGNECGFLTDNVGFYGRARHMSNLEVLDNNRIHFKTGSSTHEPYVYAGGVNGDWLKLNAYNFALNNTDGSPRIEHQASTGKTVFFANTHVNKDFTVSGSKNSLQKTKNYGDRLLNALETAGYFFKDIGSGKTDETGYCYIYIEDIFNETVNTNMQYYVDVQKYGTGDIYPIKRTPVYFVIKGTPNLEFGWTLTAKRVGYEYDRLEQIFDEHESAPTSLDWLMEDETIKEDNEELRTIIDKELSKRSDDNDI